MAELSAVESELGDLEGRIRAAEQAVADGEAVLVGLREQVRESGRGPVHAR